MGNDSIHNYEQLSRCSPLLEYLPLFHSFQSIFLRVSDKLYFQTNPVIPYETQVSCWRKKHWNPQKTPAARSSQALKMAACSRDSQKRELSETSDDISDISMGVTRLYPISELYIYNMYIYIICIYIYMYIYTYIYNVYIYIYV